MWYTGSNMTIEQVNMWQYVPVSVGRNYSNPRSVRETGVQVTC